MSAAVNIKSVEAEEGAIHSFAEELNDFVKSRLYYKLSSAHVAFNTINVHRARIDLYIRFKPTHYWPPATIVLVRIGFAKQRKGHGSALLSFLIESASKYGLTHIAVECANEGPSIQSFLRKYEFCPYGNPENNGWIISVLELKAILFRDDS